MDSITDLYRKRQGTGLTTCLPPPPRCLTCGMLECMCRPRFFAGQVLGADDLNRLDAYIRAKHRLHNRQLHGWGVVNGLEVTCNPCGDGVAVSCGYALSPCGDDIVVCDAVSVAVCDLIKRCKDAERGQLPCPSFQAPNSGGCDAAEEEWILAIRYSETPARGVKPLYAAPASACGCGTPGCGCGCGGTGGTGCTCGNTPASKAKPRNAPVQCEATVVCEGFAFEVYRAPDTTQDPEKGGTALPSSSELAQRFQCCFDALVTKAPQMPGAFNDAAVQANPQAWYLWACRFDDHLTRFFQSRPGYNCALLARLASLVIPQPTSPNAVTAFEEAVGVMLVVWIDGMFACLCSALLPPCPTPTDEVRVPLAAVHVAYTPSCRVLRVCNWTVERRFATTFPALKYWLGVCPLGTALRELLELLCCSDLGALLTPPQDNVDNLPEVNLDEASAFAPRYRQKATARLNPDLANPGPVEDGVALVTAALLGDEMLDPQRLVETFLVPKSAAGTQPLSATERRWFPQFLALRSLARPLAGSALQPAMASVLATSFAPRTGERVADTRPAEDTSAMRREIGALRAAVESQAAEVARLREAVNRGGGNP